MIHLSNLQLRRGPEPLLKDVSVSILQSEKVGLVGRNGCGKSSLLVLLSGELRSDCGEFELPRKLAVSSVAQELLRSQQPTVKHVIDGDIALHACEREFSKAEKPDDGLHHSHVLGGHDALGEGYTARTRAAELRSRFFASSFEKLKRISSNPRRSESKSSSPWQTPRFTASPTPHLPNCP